MIKGSTYFGIGQPKFALVCLFALLVQHVQGEHALADHDQSLDSCWDPPCLSWPPCRDPPCMMLPPCKDPPCTKPPITLNEGPWEGKAFINELGRNKSASNSGSDFQQKARALDPVDSINLKLELVWKGPYHWIFGTTPWQRRRQLQSSSPPTAECIYFRDDQYSLLGWIDIELNTAWVERTNNGSALPTRVFVPLGNDINSTVYDLDPSFLPPSGGIIEHMVLHDVNATCDDAAGQRRLHLLGSGSDDDSHVLHYGNFKYRGTDEYLGASFPDDGESFSRVGVGSDPLDFGWTIQNSSFGALNPGQTFVPAPTSAPTATPTSAPPPVGPTFPCRFLHYEFWGECIEAPSEPGLEEQLFPFFELECGPCPDDWY